MIDYASHVSPKSTSQFEPVLGKNMVSNSAGGYGFAVDDWARLDRFLVLGNEGGTYYASEKELTIENAKCVLRCLALDPKQVVDRIVDVSGRGLAPKNDAAIFSLAMTASYEKGQGDLGHIRSYALSKLDKVCRTGTHLFQFAAAADKLRGWGRTLREAVASWYTSKEPKDLAYQVTKYQSRNGWSHRDLLRLSHPKAEGGTDYVLAWAVGKPKTAEISPNSPYDPAAFYAPIAAFEMAKLSTTPIEVANIIRRYHLPRECVPTQFLNSAAVWDALLADMPMTAMVRNLATMTRIGLLTPYSEATKLVHNRLLDRDRLRKGRVHPVALLLAQRVYAAGKGYKSDKTWTPVSQIVDALDEAFYLAFETVEPTGKNWLVAVDVSGSMSFPVAGTPLSACEAATAMALVTQHLEPWCGCFAFNQGLSSLPFSRKTKLDEALRYTRNINGGGTDCALPMLYAAENRLPIDAFLVLTDNETWAGKVHPFQALDIYRRLSSRPAKLIVVGLTSTGFTIADPDDAGMLDVVGFSADVPVVISQFVAE